MTPTILLGTDDRDRYEELFIEHQKEDGLPENAMISSITQLFRDGAYVGAVLLIFDEYSYSATGIPVPLERHWLHVDAEWNNTIFKQRDELYTKLQAQGFSSVRTVSYFLSEDGIYEQDIVGTINVAECVSLLSMP